MAPVCRLVTAAAAIAVNTSSDPIDPSSPSYGGLSSRTLALVKENMIQAVNSRCTSWELGTATEALLEYEWPALSVFNTSAFPPPRTLSASSNASDVLGIAYQVVSAKSSDSLTLMQNTAVGDPASLGVAVLLANWTRTNPSDNQQLDYLLNVAPRTSTGAISHRSDETQLWADFVYMAPPFIAYYGSLEGGSGEISLIQTAYDQISLYRDVLRDDSGLWQHILLGSWSDTTHWGTGNAWAAAGMLRVLMTMNHTTQGYQFIEQSANLTTWINEILESAWQYQAANGTLLNVLDDYSSFADSSSTAMMAAVTWLATKHRRSYTFTTATVEGGYSPEGQAFVVLLDAAHRDWIRHNTTS
ncbi:glycoside hydrolase family 105 protein [Mucidula mucida]|nr:glycoside hydrolase family 105 protein [Mucidula mucida]